MSLDREGGEHAQDGCTASYIQYDFVLEQVLILINCVSVRLGANFIFLKRSLEKLVS